MQKGWSYKRETTILPLTSVHVLPLYSGKHKQVNDPFSSGPSIQVPPDLHGLLWHANKKKKTKLNIYNKEFVNSSFNRIFLFDIGLLFKTVINRG